MLDRGVVKSVELNTSTGEIRYTAEKDKKQQEFYTTRFPGDTNLVEKLNKKGVRYSAISKQADQSAALISYLITAILPFALIIGAFLWINRRIKKAMGDDNPSMTFGGGFGSPFGAGLGKSGAKVVNGEETGVTFKDVAGQDEACLLYTSDAADE